MIYHVAKDLINKGAYDKKQMEEDLSLFKMFNVITAEQYLELMKLMNTPQEEK